MSVKEITDMTKKGELRRMSMIEPVCPPKHTNTDAYALVNPETVGAKNIAFFCVEIHPGGAAEEDTHPNIEHGYFLISGKGLAKVEGEEFNMEPGDCLWIPPGARHEIKPIGDEKISFAVFSSPPR